MSLTIKNSDSGSFQWAIVGAGPAGIAAVGKLLDMGIPPTEILWIDPNFKVGDLGALWSNISSNTKVSLFTQFLESIHSFNAINQLKHFKLFTLDPDATCKLQYIVDPLQAITQDFLEKVRACHSLVKKISLVHRHWEITTDSNQYKANKVILATGAVPLHLNYQDVELLPFDTAIDPIKLEQVIDTESTYAVFGSSHSAIMIIKNLVDLGLKKIINFYRSPCRYAIPLEDWILFDNTGLKGETAQWAKEHIDGNLPPNLYRYLASEQNIARHLPECNKVIYAVGFEKRHNILLGDLPEIQYNPHNGIIAPGLFGFGIAYPELKTDPLGNQELQVGIWKFLQYLNKVMPLWVQYSA